MFKVRIGPKNEGQTQTLDSGLVNSYNCSSHPAEAKDKDSLVTETGIPVGCLPVTHLNVGEKGSEILGRRMHGPVGCEKGEGISEGGGWPSEREIL